jgi:ribosomal-protein-alanine N-acetyltransferase
MILLSPAVVAHAPVLEVLHAAGFPDAWSAASIASLLENPANFGLVAMAGEGAEAAGFALGQTAADEAEVLTIAVAPWSRRQGVGRALLKALIEMSAARGARDLFLEVAADNRAAIQLYLRAGFARVGTRPGYYARADSAMDAVMMRLALVS